MRLWSRLTCLSAIAAMCVLTSGPGAHAAARDEAIAIPFVDRISIDGNARDWGDRGFRVDVTRVVSGKEKPDDGFAPRFRLGWNDSGLLCLFEVRDQDISEASGPSDSAPHDAIQVNWSGWPESKRVLWAVISPGINPKLGAPAVYPGDPKQPEHLAAAAAIRTASQEIPGGYAVEALLPWSLFEVKAIDGADLRFRVTLRNADRSGATTECSWYPVLDSAPILHLRLAREAAFSVAADIPSLEVEHYKRILARIRTTADLAGKTLVVKSGKQTLANCQVTPAGDGFGSATAALPIPWGHPGYDRLDVLLGDRRVGEIVPPAEIGVMYPRALEDANLRFSPYVFDGTDFPRCDFEQAALAEDILGPYTIDVTFYDKDYNVVKSAEKPGRYGAVIDVKPKSGGPVIRRFRTVYRQPQSYDWWSATLDATVRLPKELGIDPKVAEAESSSLKEMLKGGLLDACARERYAPALLAGLSEMKPTGVKAPVYANAGSMDRRWWLTLKRKLYGADTKCAEQIVAPRPVDGRPATVLHEGTLAEAGMKPDAVEKIDAVLGAWVADSDEPFAALVARHGVIVLQKAYGQRDGAPMTITSKSWMASITKTLSANLMMMLVDQGLIDLDDDAGTYLPPLREVKVAKPLTIRHLYTHTSGFPEMDHWGDEMSDMEYLVADYYPRLKVGEVRVYNGAGIGLGGKIIEVISGETIPEFYQKHLLGPLGCANTDVVGTYGDARSVPLDIAKVGQMMLNRGAYGTMRFYSEETFAKMLPGPMTKVLGRDTGETVGIGLWQYDYLPGLSKSTFGHGAASSATFLVDPVNELVIVMTRNTAGKNFTTYHRQFIQAIVDGMAGASG